MNRALDGVAEGQEAVNTGTAAAGVNQCRTAALAALAADWHDHPAPLSHDPNHNHSLCTPESHSDFQGDDSVATHTYCPHCTLATENYEMRYMGSISQAETLRLPHQLGAAGLWAVTVVPQHSVWKITCRLLRRA